MATDVGDSLCWWPIWDVKISSDTSLDRRKFQTYSLRLRKINNCILISWKFSWILSIFRLVKSIPNIRFLKSLRMPLRQKNTGRKSLGHDLIFNSCESRGLAWTRPSGGSTLNFFILLNCVKGLFVKRLHLSIQVVITKWPGWDQYS